MIKDKSLHVGHNNNQKSAGNITVVNETLVNKVTNVREDITTNIRK